MGIRHIIYLLLFCSTGLLAQTEEQLKFSVEKPDEFKSYITSSPKIGELESQFHSKNYYADIYLDTPDKLLLKNNLSLRFRKRIFDDSLHTITYSMQLKNEMNSVNSIRMEVEEPELNFYFIQHNNRKINLTNLLDTVFKHYEETPTSALTIQTKLAIRLIEKWIIQKSEAPIAPFQKLRVISNIKVSGIENLKLVTCGYSNRYRSHIYLNDESSTKVGIPRNKIKRDKLPPFFLKNYDYNWLLETSFDNSTFYLINPLQTKKVNLVEYEVEQKHYDKNSSKQIFELFKSEVNQKFVLTSKLDSKYKQMQTLFLK